MTASSVELFPCRVQLMGLPRSTRIASSNATSLDKPKSPSISRTQAISRNLFGAPDPVEMKNLYYEESQRQHLYVLQRYNIDTKNLEHMTNDAREQRMDNYHTRQMTLNHEIQHTQFPTLIDNELRQHELHLQDRLNFKRYTLESPLSNEHISNRVKKNARCEISLASLTAFERQKPYSRQSLLTEQFNFRKSKPTATKTGDYCDAEMMSLVNNQICNTSLGMKQLHEFMSSEKRNFVIKEKDATSSILDENYNQTHNEINSKRSTIIDCNDNCTTLSLQVVVSSQNLS